jgi:uncharacterized Tic20 family protein
LIIWFTSGFVKALNSWMNEHLVRNLPIKSDSIILELLLLCSKTALIFRKAADMTNQTITPTSDESLLAAISHFFGFLVAFIVWATQKEKSRFIRFQSIQAMAFDLCVSIIMLLVVVFTIVFVFGVLALGVGDIAILGSQANPTAETIRTLVALMTAVPFLIPCVILSAMGVVLVVRLIATVQTFQGKNFHYPLIGALVERSIGY